MYSKELFANVWAIDNNLHYLSFQSLQLFRMVTTDKHNAQAKLARTLASATKLAELNGSVAVLTDLSKCCHPDYVYHYILTYRQPGGLH